MTISSVGNLGYTPYVSTFTSKKSSTPENFEFKPGLYDPEARERSAKRKKNILKILGSTILAVGACVLLKNTKFGKNLLERIKKLFGTKTTTNAVNQAKPEKVKLKPRKRVIAEHSDLAPGEKVKMKNNGGKEAIRKVRRNKKSIIEQTRLREEAEAITSKDLDAYQKSLGTPATAAESKFIAENNRPAVNTMADIMESQGIQRAKDAKGKVVLQKNAAPASAQITPAAAPVVSTSERIAKLETDVAKCDEMIAKWSTPGMKRFAKPYETQKAKLLKELQELTVQSKAA